MCLACTALGCQSDGDGPRHAEFVSDSTHGVGIGSNCIAATHDGICTGCQDCRAKNSDCRPQPYFAFGGYSSILDEYTTRRAAIRCSRKALRDMQHRSGYDHSSHFEAGFRQAYLDMAMGGSGVIPPVPPKKYWSAHYRTPEGNAHAHQWLTGYGVGVEFTQFDGGSQANSIPTSVAGGEESSR